jgi:hypothetical protein
MNLSDRLKRPQSGFSITDRERHDKPVLTASWLISCPVKPIPGNVLDIRPTRMPYNRFSQAGTASDIPQSTGKEELCAGSSRRIGGGDRRQSIAQAILPSIGHPLQQWKICRFVLPAGGCFAPRHGQAVTLHSATRWSKGNANFRVDREVNINLVTQLAMRVQAPPFRCRSESVSPRSATGPQGSEAGINGGP